MINHNHITTGSIVRYTDISNTATYAVVDIDNTNSWNPYKLVDTTDYSITTSDLKQAGWQIIANSK